MGGFALNAGVPAVFFDRDGVLNKAVVLGGRPYPPACDQIVLEDDIEDALARLEPIIPLMFVVTNQPDVARGTSSRTDVEIAHRFLAARLPITAFFACFHDDSDDCDCRKPRPGSLLRAQTEYDIDLACSYMVGDRWRDIDAGARAGTTTVFVDRHYRERAPAKPPDFIVSSTAAAVDTILRIHSARCAPGVK